MNPTKLLSLTRTLWAKAQVCNPDLDLDTLYLSLDEDQSITKVNRSVFHRDHPTDVISLLYDAQPGDEDGSEAEVFVNLEQALRGESDQFSPPRELALYIAHGLHHLTGATDDTPEERDAMLHAETQWVDAVEQDGFLQGLFV